LTQEALTNVVRHAQADVAFVELMWTGAGVELSAVDDGIGFEASERAGSGLGLRSIDERVRLTRGRVTLESEPAQGTNLSVRIPLAAPEGALALES
jgi:signal transduction histidine kinase